MIPRISIKNQFLYFFLGYTLFLLLTIFIYFSLTERRAIIRKAQDEVHSKTHIFNQLLNKSLQDCQTEIGGLRATLEFYLGKSPADLIPGSSLYRPIQEFLLAYPFKYAEIVLYQTLDDHLLRFRPVKEFDEVELAVEHLTGEVWRKYYRVITRDSLGNSFNSAFSLDALDRVIRFIQPLKIHPSFHLAAEVHLDYLLDQIVEKLSLTPSDRLILTDKEGVVLYTDDLSMRQRLIHYILPDLYLNPDSWNTLTSRIESHDHKITYLDRIGSMMANFIFQKDLQNEVRLFRSRIRNILIFTGALVLSALLVIRMIANRMTASLEHITRVAHAVAKGDFTLKIHINRKDEVGLLIDAFNNMTDKLQENYRALNLANRQLERKINELTHARKKLSQKQRLALLGEASSKISHEIQNKIGGVSIWIQNLEKYSTGDEKTSYYIQEMKSALTSFMEMMVNFKRFYREPQLQTSRIRISDIVNASLLQMQSELDAKHIKVSQEKSMDITIEADRTQIIDSLVNILLNAMYYTSEGGTIDLNIRHEKKWAVLSCCDNGPGLVEEDMEHLFQPFYTNKPGGSGLGLAIVNNIIKAHGGQIRAFNRKEGGACFEIRLPAS